MTTLRVAQAQITSGADLDANLRLVAEQTARAADAGARLVTFPEATMRAFGLPLVPDWRPSPIVGRVWTPAFSSAAGGCMFTTSAPPG